MANNVPVTQERHAEMRWQHPKSYSFVAREMAVPVGALELVSAVPTMPLAFFKGPTKYICVALTGLEEGKNLFVGPSGQWLGIYTPAVWRAYPFSLRYERDAPSTLCFDEDSGLLADASADGAERFYDADGTLSAAATAVKEFLTQCEQDRSMIDAAIVPLAEAGVIVPWPMTVPVGNRSVTLGNLYRVDEQALNTLDDSAFLRLRKSSSLFVAYAQLLSMGQIGSLLARLARIEQQSGLTGKQFAVAP
jgi:hypothetical protein